MNKGQREELDYVINEIDSIKMDLMRCMDRLEESGLQRKAKSLGTIIGKLEAWQHTR